MNRIYEMMGIALLGLTLGLASTFQEAEAQGVFDLSGFTDVNPILIPQDGKVTVEICAPTRTEAVGIGFISSTDRLEHVYYYEPIVISPTGEFFLGPPEILLLPGECQTVMLPDDVSGMPLVNEIGNWLYTSPGTAFVIGDAGSSNENPYHVPVGFDATFEIMHGMVNPESPIGAIAIIGSSMTAMGVFAGRRRFTTKA